MSQSLQGKFEQHIVFIWGSIEKNNLSHYLDERLMASDDRDG